MLAVACVSGFAGAHHVAAPPRQVCVAKQKKQNCADGPSVRRRGGGDLATDERFEEHLGGAEGWRADYASNVPSEIRHLCNCMVGNRCARRKKDDVV